MADQMSIPQLVSHFFDPKVSYESKKYIEQQLMCIRQQSDTWLHCVSAMQQQESLDPNMLWFCLSVFEELIHRKWDSLEESNQANLRSFLLSYMESYYSKKSPAYVTNKLIKTIADIAKRTWPQKFPELFETIQRLIFDRRTRSLGLSLLKTCSEEFTSTKNDVQTVRRQELRLGLQDQIPHILILMKQILDHALCHPNTTTENNNHQRSFSARDCSAGPSPPSNQISPVPYGFLSIATGVGGAEDRTSVSSLVSPLSANFDIPRPPLGNFDEDTLDACLLALEIISQLFTWIPLDKYLSMPILSTILQYTMLNDSFDAPLGCQSLSCVIELLSRRAMPKEFNEYFLLIFRYLIESLKHFIVEADNFVIDDLDEDYRMRFTECLSKYVQLYMHRLETIPDFPALILLEGISKYTFEQPNIFAFRECLVLWTDFLKYLLSDTNTSGLREKYRPLVVAFGHELLCKVQYLENPSYLSDLEDSLENSDGLTESDQFIDEVLVIFRYLSELYPEEIMSDSYGRLQRIQTEFLALLESSDSNRRSLEGTANAYYIFKDLKTYLRLFGALADIFTGSFESSFLPTFSMLDKFVHIIYGCVRLYEAYSNSMDFIKLCNESYLIYNAYIPWLSKFKEKSSGIAELEAQFDQICSSILAACLLIIGKDTPETIVCAPASIFKAICIKVKPEKLFLYARVGDLISNIHVLSLNLPREAKRDIYIGVSLACLELFSKNNNLSHEYQSFIRGVTDPFLQIASQPQFPQSSLTPENQPRFNHVLTILSALIESIQGEKQTSKLILLDAIKDVLPACLTLFEHTASHPELRLAVIDLFLNIFSSLQKQIGPELVERVTRILVGGLNTDQIQRLLDCNGQTGVELINKLLSLLRIMALDNTRAFEAFLPGMIQFTLNQCGPVIVGRNDSEAVIRVAESYYELIHGIIIQNLKYFMPISGQPSEERLNELICLMEAIIKSFESNNLEVCRLNLNGIKEIGNKTRLLHNPIFVANIRPLLATTLLGALVEKTLDSLREDIISTIYQLAAVDMGAFFSDILLPFIDRSLINEAAQNGMKQILKKTQMQDFPTFSLQISSLIDDINYYRHAQVSISVAPPV